MAPAPQLRWAVLALLLSLSTTTTTCAGAAAARHVSTPPSAAPAPAMDAACLNSLLNMSDCLPYVQAGSTTRRPDAACCPELAGMVGSNPVCLCELLSGAADSFGIAVDYSRALALPGACRVATPAVSTCAALGYNVRGLAPSAVPMPGSPSPAVSPSGDGPQFPGSSPFASPPAPNHAARRFPAAAGSLVSLAVAVTTGML